MERDLVPDVFRPVQRNSKENSVDNDLVARLNSASANLQRRALEMDKSGQESDTALLMQGLATAMEAIRALAVTAGRLDGPPGLGKAAIRIARSREENPAP